MTTLERAAGGTPDAVGGSADEIDRLRERLEEAEETLRAILAGEVDALVIHTAEGPRTYTLVTIDESYRMLVEQMREPALTLGEDGTILYSNGRLCGILDRGRDTLVGQQLAQLAAPASRAAVRELIERARGEAVTAEVMLHREDGTAVPFQLSLSPLATGTFRGICALATDLTEQKQRERDAAAERLTRAVLEFAGTPIAVCDADGRILQANRVASDLFGDALENASFDELLPSGPRFHELKASLLPEEPELEHITADGCHLFFQARARPVGDAPPADTSRWVVTLVDITHLRELEVARSRALAAERSARVQAEQANLAKTQFLAVMSHELRTPLTAVIGYADLIAAGIGGSPTEAQGQYIERIKAGAWHLLGLIEGILDYARVDAGKETVSMAQADLGRIARDVAALVGAQATAKGLALVLHIPDTLPLRTDADKMRQILANLLGNAVKFTEVGQVEVTVERTDTHAFCHVADTGPGIRPEDLDRIFEPFVQVDQSPTRRKGGTGLGLAIAHHFAELIGAELSVSSQVRVGSRFTVKVPLA